CASKLSGLALTASESRRSTAGRSGEMLLCAAASAGANERKPRATTVVINFFPLAPRPPASARRHVSASDGGPARSFVHLRAERAEAGLAARGDRGGIRERRRIVELIAVVAAGVGIADDECVTAGAGSGRPRAVNRLRLAAVERQHPVDAPAADGRSAAWQIV